MRDEEELDAATEGTEIGTGVVRPPGEAGSRHGGAEGGGLAELDAIAARIEAGCQVPHGEGVEAEPA